MRPLRIIEDEVTGQRGACLADTVVSAYIDLLVFDRSPQPLDENIVPPGAAPIHANRDRVLYQQSRESGAAELAALVRVENFRPPMFGKRLFHRFEAEVHFHCDRQTPRQNPPAEP